MSILGSSIQCHDLTLGYNRHPAVHHLSGEFCAGSLTAICGPNGAGKSTLLKGITGNLRPLGGHITIVPETKNNIAYLPQLSEVDRSFPINVYDLVATGLWDKIGLFKGISRKQRDKVHEVIASVGLTGFERRAISTLSGGQMQRTLFARLLLQNAAIILLDEPFNAIDTKTVQDLLMLIQQWHHEGRTVIAVLHDMELVRRSFPQALLIAREQIAWGPTAEALCSENLLKARTMIEADDPHATNCERAA